MPQAVGRGLTPPGSRPGRGVTPPPAGRATAQLPFSIGPRLSHQGGTLPETCFPLVPGRSWGGETRDDLVSNTYWPMLQPIGEGAPGSRALIGWAAGRGQHPRLPPHARLLGHPGMESRSGPGSGGKRQQQVRQGARGAGRGARGPSCSGPGSPTLRIRPERSATSNRKNVILSFGQAMGFPSPSLGIPL